MHNEAVAHRDSPTKVPGLAILLTDNFIEQVFTGGVLLKKPLLEKFYWRSYTVGNVFILIIFRVGKRKISWRNPVPGEILQKKRNLPRKVYSRTRNSDWM